MALMGPSSNETRLIGIPDRCFNLEEAQNFIPRLRKTFALAVTRCCAQYRVSDLIRG